MIIPSPLINDAVEEISKLPGIGKKTALRLALHLLKNPIENTQQLSKAIESMRTNIKYCTICGNISESEKCTICTNHNRDASVICVVVDFPDIISIENTHQYKGLYHVLGGIIAPVQGVGPSDLTIDALYERVKKTTDTKEIVCALSSTLEGDTTAYYIANMFEDLSVKVTTLARGISVGEELEYIDEVTLGQSIQARKAFI